MHGLEHVGPRLRAARVRMDWTLEDVAHRTGLSISTISRVESGKRQLTLEILLPLTRELGIRLDDLVQPDVQDPRIRRATSHRNGMAFTPLSRGGSPFTVYKVVYPQAKNPVPQQMHQGFEWFYVLSGTLRLLLGDKEFFIGPGEAAEFDTGLPHSLNATGPRPAELLSIFNHAGALGHREGAERDPAR